MDLDSRNKKAFGKMDTTRNLSEIINAPVVHVPFQKIWKQFAYLCLQVTFMVNICTFLIMCKGPWTRKCPISFNFILRINLGLAENITVIVAIIFLLFNYFVKILCHISCKNLS